MTTRRVFGVAIALATVMSLSSLLAACSFSSGSGSIPPAQYQVDIRQNVAYGPLPGEVLDICVPSGVRASTHGVILIHGGGWMSGAQRQDDPICRNLAARGFVAASINYRLSPTFTWPDQLVDAQLAVRWLRAHASAYSLDVNHLCSWGDSAGAQLALFLGMLRTIHSGDEASLYPNQPVQTTCVVDQFGPTDLTSLYNRQGPGSSLDDQTLTALFGGVTPQSDPQIYQDASPINFVSASTAPTLIVQGTQDTTVPESQSQTLYQALQKAGVTTQYVSYSGRHEYTGVSASDVNTLREQMVAFLSAHD